MASKKALSPLALSHCRRRETQEKEEKGDTLISFCYKNRAEGGVNEKKGRNILNFSIRG